MNPEVSTSLFWDPVNMIGYVKRRIKIVGGIMILRY
jgi:hypothetical protein